MMILRDSLFLRKKKDNCFFDNMGNKSSSEKDKHPCESTRISEARRRLVLSQPLRRKFIITRTLTTEQCVRVVDIVYHHTFGVKSLSDIIARYLLSDEEVAGIATRIKQLATKKLTVAEKKEQETLKTLA